MDRHMGEMTEIVGRGQGYRHGGRDRDRGTRTGIEEQG